MEINNLYLTDEDIYEKDPSFEEQSLLEKVKKLEQELEKIEDKLDNAENIIEKISKILEKGIADNIGKTKRTATISLIKSYRESLMVLRDIEKEIDKYNEQKLGQDT